MNWWNQGDYPLKNKSSKLLKILDFYLFNCPVVKNKINVSVRGKTFQQRNMQGKQLTRLLSEMKDCVTYCEFIDPKQNLEHYVKTISNNKPFKDTNFQLIVLHKNSNLAQAISIFDSIRNAFAHGAFSIKKTKRGNIYFLENCYKKVIKAQFRINESTLIKWIDLVEKYSK